MLSKTCMSKIMLSVKTAMLQSGKCSPLDCGVAGFKSPGKIKQIWSDTINLPHTIRRKTSVSKVDKKSF